MNAKLPIEGAATSDRAAAAMLGYLARSAECDELNLNGTDALLNLLSDMLTDAAAALENLAGGGIPKIDYSCRHRLAYGGGRL